jgi:hypothetical protein
MSDKMLLAQNDFAKKGTIWVLFLFLGWSYGSLGKIGLQILYYLTLGGLGLWALVRLFTLSGAIREYNKQICIRYGLTPEEMMQLGVVK